MKINKQKKIKIRIIKNQEIDILKIKKKKGNLNSKTSFPKKISFESRKKNLPKK